MFVLRLQRLVVLSYWRTVMFDQTYVREEHTKQQTQKHFRVQKQQNSACQTDSLVFNRRVEYSFMIQVV